MPLDFETAAETAAETTTPGTTALASETDQVTEQSCQTAAPQAVVVRRLVGTAQLGCCYQDRCATGCESVVMATKEVCNRRLAEIGLVVGMLAARRTGRAGRVECARVD